MGAATYLSDAAIGMIEKIKELIDRYHLSEVLLNGAHATWGIERHSGQSIELANIFRNDLELIEALQVHAFADGGRLDARMPFAGGSVWDGGGRWHAVIPPVASSGAIATFRWFGSKALSLDQFCQDTRTKANIAKVMAGASPIVIIGDTGAGKTSLLTALLGHFCLDERLCIIESYAEIALQSRRWIRLNEVRADVEGLGGVDLGACVEQSLRLRPDRIVQGEIRGSEIRDFLKVSLLGHRAAISTAHGSCIEDFQARLRLEAAAYQGPFQFVAIEVSRDGHQISRISNTADDYQSTVLPI